MFKYMEQTYCTGTTIRCKGAFTQDTLALKKSLKQTSNEKKNACVLNTYSKTDKTRNQHAIR